MSKKKSYRDLKNEIIELKEILAARDGRIAVLLLADAKKDEKIQEYKGMIKSLESQIKRKSFKIPFRTDSEYKKCSCGKDATVKYYGKPWCDDCFDEIK